MDRFAQTLQQSNQVGAPTDNPLGASNAPLLQKFFNAQFQGGAGSRALGAFATDQANQVEAAKQAAEQDRQQKLADSKDKIQKIQDAINGKNYQQVQKHDGGYDYMDPLGNKITLLQYSKATGKEPQDLLKNSNNALDQQYVTDYNHLNDITGAIQSNDNKKLNKIGVQLYGDNSLGEDDPKNKAAIQKIQQFRKLDPQQIFKSFAQYYPNVYSDLKFNQFDPGTSQVHPGGLTDLLRNNQGF